MVNEVILVDTSVMIGFIKGDSNTSVDAFIQIPQKQNSIAVSILTYEEVLRGAKSEFEFLRLDRLVSAFNIIFLPTEKSFYKEVSNIYLKLRKRGITIPSVPDIMIALTAVKANHKLLHNDKHFDEIKTVLPELETL